MCVDFDLHHNPHSMKNTEEIRGETPENIFIFAAYTLCAKSLQQAITIQDSQISITALKKKKGLSLVCTQGQPLVFISHPSAHMKCYVF